MEVCRYTWPLLLVLVSSQAQALVEPKATSWLESLLTGQVVIHTTTKSALAVNAGAGATLEVDDLTGAPRLVGSRGFAHIEELDSGATLAEYVAQAKEFTTSNFELVGVRWPDLVLVKDSVLQDDDVTFLDFNVFRNDVLIEDANVAFRFKRGRLIQVQLQSFAEAVSVGLKSNVNLDQHAKTVLGTADVARGPDVFRTIANTKGYELILVATYRADVAGEPVTLQLDYRNGHVFQAVSERHYAGEGEATAEVYPRTWFQSATESAPISEATLTVGASTILTDLTGIFQASSAPRLDGFKGSRVNVVPSTGTLVRKDAIARGNGFVLSFTDIAEKNLAQAMAYRHVNFAVQHAKQYITTAWLDRALRANVNLSQTCNAYWDGTTINFYSAGGSCANTALISDVIYHEWGHGLDANTGGISDGAFSEGYGDIIAMLMAKDPVTAPGFKTNGSGIRNLEPDKVYPRDRGEVHAEGLIIGGTFWDLYKALVAKYDEAQALDLISKYAYKMIFTARRYTDVYAALKVIDDDDGDLSNKTPNYCELNAAFTLHGLATTDAGCQRGG